jgi:large subunit ribosomal protein L22
MTNYRYSTETGKEATACAAGRDLSISTKFSVEICRLLRYRNLQKAKNLLVLALEKKRAIPFKRHICDLGHKPGMAAGRYPIKACEGIMEVLNSVEKNAVFKNMNPDNLKIIHICAQMASRPRHPGRHGGRKSKRSHIEIVVAEEKPVQKSQKIKTEKKAHSQKPQEGKQ